MKIKRSRIILCVLLAALIFTLALATAAYADDEPGAPELTIAYKNLSYSSNIFVLYAVRHQNVASPERISMLFWTAPQDGGYL
ncbi:MAG: hypothetical protein IJS65_01095, partial [Clostridia bacterium]|nr:hypothetical protein [Clostridia bacterium]